MDFAARLKSGGYKMTAPRRAVHLVLLESKGPLNPEEIHALSGEICPGIGIATVYRNLELFCELGIAQHVHLHESSNYYELSKDEHHHHLVCVSCGSMSAVRECLVADMERSVRDEIGFEVTSHCLSLFGYCGECREAGGAAS